MPVHDSEVQMDSAVGSGVVDVAEAGGGGGTSHGAGHVASGSDDDDDELTDLTRSDCSIDVKGIGCISSSRTTGRVDDLPTDDDELDGLAGGDALWRHLAAGDFSRHDVGLVPLLVVESGRVLDEDLDFDLVVEIPDGPATGGKARVVVDFDAAGCQRGGHSGLVDIKCRHRASIHVRWVSSEIGRKR